MYIKVSPSPDGAKIDNPIMVGAVINYKATAIQLAAQVLSLNHALDELQSAEASLLSKLSKQSDLIRDKNERLMDWENLIVSVYHHWSSIFWPARFRNEARLIDNQ